MSPRTTPETAARADARDRGLRRVRTATGWITIASTAGAVVLAGAYAEAMPGKPAAKPASPSSTPRPAGNTPTPAKSSASPKSSAAAPSTSLAPALKAPAQAPTTAPSTAQSQATSGGS